MTRSQDTVTGAFEGTVTNSQTGEVIAGATVQIINQQTGRVSPKTSDTRGRFYQGLLNPGIYLIRVSAVGFQTKEVRQRLFITRTGEVVPVPVALDPAPAITTATPANAAPTSSTRAVEDTDTRTRINVADGQRGGAFTEEEVSSLPLGATTIVRSFDELALLLPGVAPPPQTLGSVAGPGVGAGVGTAGQFAVNGLRSRGNNFTVDGSDNNDEDIGVRRQGFVALVPQPVESIKEYQAITLLAPAQFGRNIGAQVNAVSKSGGEETHGTLFGLFNASQLNARNPFDTMLGNRTTQLLAGGRPVLRNGRQVSVTNGSGGEDSFTAGQFGLVLGGALVPSTARRPERGLFYFISGEGQLINATREESFAVPTVEQRGLFGTGASGLARDPLTGRVLQCTSQLCEFGFPTTVSGDAVFSLFPFPNNPAGLYGANTFTQVLPSGGHGRVFSGKTDGYFALRGRPQQLTVRYNYTDDYRDIPATGGALFSALRARVKTQNLSNFLNSELSTPGSPRPVFNQVRASYGRTRLVFDEIRETQFLSASRLANAFTPAARQFLLNAPLLANDTLPNGTNVLYDNFFNFGVEDVLGPIGQVSIAGYSPVGVDVFNFPQRRVDNTYQLADSLTARLPRHSLAFGVDLRRSELNSDLPRNARSLITFNGAPRLVSTAAGQTELRGYFNPLDLAAASAPSGVFQALTNGAGSAINLRYYQLNFYAQDEWRVRRNLSLSYGLRYEYNTPPRELNRRIENTFSDPALALVAGLRVFETGRTSIFDPDRNNFAPRASIAYATHLLGSSRATVLRAGAGIFYDQALGAVVSQSRNVFPNFLTLNLAGGVPSEGGVGFNITDPSRPFFPCPDGSGGLRFFALTQPGSLNQLNLSVPLACLVSVNNSFPGGFGVTLPERRLEMPTAYHYAFTFEQQLAGSLVFSVAYVGTQGRHLLRLTTPNLGPNAFLIPTTINIVNNQPNVAGRALGPGQRIGANGALLGGRPVNQAGAVTIYESSANSSYNSLQLQLRGRLQRAMQFQLAYTFAKATDDVSDVFDLAGASALPQDSFNLAAERAPANFDVRHRLAYNFVYDLPAFEHKFARAIFGNLQLAGSGALQTGQPFTVNSIFDVNLDGNLTDRLNTNDGLVITGDRRQPLRLSVADPTTLLAPVGQNGRVGRNSFRAGNVVALDIALARRFSLTQQQSLTARVEIFNFINRANYGIPVRFLEAPGFGQAINTVTPARRLQFALKYSF
ncbi:MAG TPA: carboxypeptidase regulatory-like domain-containing protein [Pyrinomonadaceae bacterium]|nr:carboxypeptidase regulatory-like domain-containing protein [Pyrinomonadaceae bacterium]